MKPWTVLLLAARGRALAGSVALLAAGCGCSALLDATGGLDPDALDADTASEAQIDMDGPETDLDVPLDPQPDDLDVATDEDGDTDGPSDPPLDPDAEEPGCLSNADCDDLEPCNGAETCSTGGECVDGTPPAEGSDCTSPAGLPGICHGGFCRPPGCGDGVLSGSEECDDADSVPDDGCEADCTFSCDTGADCSDGAPCTDDGCVAGGDGRVCTHPFNTDPCNDSNPCTTDDECNGAGTCAGTTYTCVPGLCEAASTCDGLGGCSVTMADPGAPCSDLDPCSRDDGCDGAGWCNGTMYTCTPGQCEATSTCDGSGGCIPEYQPSTAACDDANDCTHGDRCAAFGACQGTTYSCTPGLCIASSVCDGDGGCVETPASAGAPCNDGNPCSYTDRCDASRNCAGTLYSCTPGQCEDSSTCNGSGGCTPAYSGTSRPCNDGNTCSHTDRCNGSGLCVGTTYSCTPGECIVTSECDGAGGCTDTPAGPGTLCNDSNMCTYADDCDALLDCAGTPYACTPGQCEITSTCNGSGGCNATLRSPGWVCNDGYGCTTGDACDALGRCAGASDDSRCTSPQLCRPECFPSTGCGAPPASVTIACPDSQPLPGPASCSVNLAGKTGQSACLDCRAEVGMATISRDSFLGTSGTCSLGSWSLVTGNFCYDSISGCTLSTGGQACCNQASTMLGTVSGDCRLRSQRNTNCGASTYEEYILTRSFDTRGFTGIQACFNISDWDATSDEAIILYASDSTHASAQVFCQAGPPVAAGAADMDYLEWPYCVDLPAWAASNSGLWLSFVGHSSSNNQALYLDDIVIKGWTSGCGPTRATAFSEGFDPCPGTNPVPNLWHGWTVTGDGTAGSGPVCADVCSGGTPGGLAASDDSWTITHPVDTSTLDGDVQLCFDAGDGSADTGEWMTVSFDDGDGDGFHAVWYWENDWGTDGQCRRVCLNLSEFDPAVARNPDLQIRFQLSSNQAGEYVRIDDVAVDGALWCDGTGRVDTANLYEAGAGIYSVDLVNVTGAPLGAWATCSWDTPPDPLEGQDGTSFRY